MFEIDFCWFKTLTATIIIMVIYMFEINNIHIHVYRYVLLACNSMFSVKYTTNQMYKGSYIDKD